MNRFDISEFAITKTAQEDDHARWQTEDAPCFPRPFCVALPPKRPDRQSSVPKSVFGLAASPKRECKATAPRLPRRRFTSEIKKFPPQRPIRQDSEVLDLSNTFSCDSNHVSSLSRGESTASTIEELSDGELSLSRLEDLSRLCGSSRDWSPTRPVRQRSAGLENLRAEFKTSNNTANPASQPEWIRMWKSQGAGHESSSNQWSF